ncbi:MAG: hypothetical protein Q4P05_07510 [Actinomycetaceae bacterium]|nr:hypothetical protein [Actinomycetaceae bacterium]
MFELFIGDIPGKAWLIYALVDELETAQKRVQEVSGGINTVPHDAPSWNGQAREAFDITLQTGRRQRYRFRTGPSMRHPTGPGPRLHD